MKLWEKGIPVNKKIELFTIGKDKEFDVYLAKHDVIGNIAHAKMIQSINLLSKDELNQLTEELKKIYHEIEKEIFQIEDGVEDVHSQVELMLTRKLGDTGKKIHSGRSRNDQVLLDIKLYLRDEIKNIVNLTYNFFNLLQKKSEQYKNVIIPGYTHFQVAMPSSFGLWFGAYAESLTDDLLVLQAAYKVVNQNPLGSAAGYGSSFPLNRTLTTELLGFDDLNYNVIYAQMGRGKAERITAMGLSSVASTLSKMAMDVCLFMSQNFSFISFPDEYTTGSSIMPHKKNPDVFELIRAKCNRMQNLPQDISAITSNLPSGYHRDLQIIKEIIMPAFNELASCISIAGLMIENCIIKDDKANDQKYLYMYSVEEVNKLVLNGTPFRDAYKIIAENIKNNQFKPDKKITHTHEGSIGNLCNDKIQNKMQSVILDFHFSKAEQAILSLLK